MLILLSASLSAILEEAPATRATCLRRYQPGNVAALVAEASLTGSHSTADPRQFSNVCLLPQSRLFRVSLNSRQNFYRVLTWRCSIRQVEMKIIVCSCVCHVIYKFIFERSVALFVLESFKTAPSYLQEIIIKCKFVNLIRIMAKSFPCFPSSMLHNIVFDQCEFLREPSLEACWVR